MTILAMTDTETTGLDYADGHRIIEVGIVLVELETAKVFDKFEQRIDPRRPIDPKAELVHGISITDLIGKPIFEEVADRIVGALNRAQYLVCHNLDFDAPFLATEVSRAGRKLPSDLMGFCTMKNARWATSLGKNPNLQELCYALGVDYDPSRAHSALYDVSVMAKCFFIGYREGFFKLE